MPRGVSQALIDNPVRGTCWCGKSFDKKTEDHIHCSDYHRVLASNLRKYLPALRIPPPQARRQKKSSLDSKIVPLGD